MNRGLGTYDSESKCFEAKIRSVAASNLHSSRPNLFCTTNNFRRKQIIKHNIQIEVTLFGGGMASIFKLPLAFVSITTETANIKDRPIHARNQFTLSA